jgi:ketosteroid isomerase-like protein
MTGTDASTAFDRLLSEWDEAIVANDADRIADYADRDWLFVGEDGPARGSDFVDAVRTGRVTHDAMRHEVVSAVALGDVAIVVSRNVNSGTYDGRRFDNDEWTSDVFVRRDGAWRCLLTHLTPRRDETRRPE